MADQLLSICLDWQSLNSSSHWCLLTRQSISLQEDNRPRSPTSKREAHYSSSERHVVSSVTRCQAAPMRCSVIFHNTRSVFRRLRPQSETYLSMDRLRMKTSGSNKSP